MKKIFNQYKYMGILKLTDRKPEAVLSEHPPRTKNVTGFFDLLPRKNHTFIIYSEPLVDLTADVRIFTTSKVLNVKKLDNGCYTFETINSFYSLTNIKYSSTNSNFE